MDFLLRNKLVLSNNIDNIISDVDVPGSKKKRAKRRTARRGALLRMLVSDWRVAPCNVLTPALASGLSESKLCAVVFSLQLGDKHL